MVSVFELIAGLENKNNTYACSCMKQLEEESKISNSVYSYMDSFISMLDNENSYIRNRALILISANSKWDKDNKINNDIFKILEHISDEKPITSRTCIKGLPDIAENKPSLTEYICDALEKADISKYADSMRGLVEKDIANVLAKLKNLGNNC